VHQILTDKRLEQSTLEDAHDAFYGEAQRPIVWMSQSTVIFFQQFQRSVRFCRTRTTATLNHVKGVLHRFGRPNISHLIMLRKVKFL